MPDLIDLLHEKALDYQARAKAAEAQHDEKTAEVWAIVAVTLHELAEAHEEAA